MRQSSFRGRINGVNRVLCVDDEPNMLRTLAVNLRARGYEVDVAETGERALEIARTQPPDVVLLDLGLPGISGLEVLRSLRTWTNVPVVVLSARDAEDDKISALDDGADDYVSKPFGMGELLARLRAAMRRSVPVQETTRVETGDFVLDFATNRAEASGVEVRLTPIEWRIVEHLVRNEGRLVPGRELLQSVWGPQYGNETHYLRVHMAHIRGKLEPVPGKPRYFHTEPGMGYRFSQGY